LAGVSVNTLQEEAVIWIKRLIIEGEITLGERINEVELSNRLNMSRGPIRESLRILNQEGLVTYYPRRGMFVTKLAKDEMNEIYDIRFHLEKSAIELGFYRLGDDLIEGQMSIVEEMQSYAKANRKDKLALLDTQFHQWYVQLPGYTRLLNTWKSYNALIDLIFAKVFELGLESGDDVAENHRQLAEAAKDKDIDRLVQALEHHYMISKRNLLAIL
jgi:DNA-binding GntR family transcriptional regulator